MFCNKRKILFINVPKTASTFIKHEIFGPKNPCDIGLEDHHTIIEHQDIIEDLRGIAEHGTNSADKEWSHIFKFCVLRQPHDRLASYYLNHVHKRKGKTGSFIGREIRLKELADGQIDEPFNKWILEVYEPLMRGDREVLEKIARGKTHKLSHNYEKKIGENIYHLYLTNRDGIIDIDYFLDFGDLYADLCRMHKYYFKSRDGSSSLFKTPQLEHLAGKKKKKPKPERPYKSAYNKESLEIFEKYNKKDIEFYSLERSKQKARRRG